MDVVHLLRYSRADTLGRVCVCDAEGVSPVYVHRPIGFPVYVRQVVGVPSLLLEVRLGEFLDDDSPPPEVPSLLFYSVRRRPM